MAANANLSAALLGARTDDSGTDVDDMSAEEGRLLLKFFSEGIVDPVDAFLVTSKTIPKMSVNVGSGAAKTDAALIVGVQSGQEKYMVRLDDTIANLGITVADPINPRCDEVYVVVYDNAYDSSGTVYPDLEVRAGTPGNSPVGPGPDPAWDAYLFLAEITVGSSVTQINASDIADRRVSCGLQLQGVEVIKATSGTAVGDTIINAPTGEAIDMQINDVSEALLTASELNMRGNQITNVGNVDGVDVADHSSRHNPGGTDAIATAAPTALVDSTNNVKGTSTELALADHIHGLPNLTPDFGEDNDIESTGTSNSAGTSNEIARANHVHGIVDMRAVGIQIGQAVDTTGGDLSRIATPYADNVGASNIVTVTFTMPSGWNTASILAYGYMQREHDQASARTNLSVNIGSSLGPILATLANNLDLGAYFAQHLAVVSNSSTVISCFGGIQNANRTYQYENAAVSYIAIKAS